MTVEALLGDLRLSRLSIDDLSGMVLARHSSDRPLVVVSVNLDHIAKFGLTESFDDRFEVINIADGAPVALAASLRTSALWRRSAGADLIPRLFASAALDGQHLAIFGGQADTHACLTERWLREHGASKPPLCISPSPEEVFDPAFNEQLAAVFAEHDIRTLVVALGKPKQELWIREYGTRSRMDSLLPVGGAVDFWGGTRRRAPMPLRWLGLEWLHRLLCEPRRLARRYLLEAPAALRRLVMCTFSSSAEKQPVE